jgi:hypothetical protein
MWKWFSKIGSRADAIAAIRQTSTLFFVIAAINVAVGAFLFFSDAQKSQYVHITLDDIFGFFFLGIIVAILATFLRRANSRFSALLLLIISIYAFTSTLVVNAGLMGNLGKRNLVIALFALWASGRATLATFRLHGKFAQEQSQQRSEPILNDASYDVEKWEALLQYDDDIANAEARLRPLGQKWLDEFARAYLVLNDKRYLPNIFHKIVQAAQAEAEARS